MTSETLQNQCQLTQLTRHGRQFISNTSSPRGLDLSVQLRPYATPVCGKVFHAGGGRRPLRCATGADWRDERGISHQQACLGSCSLGRIPRSWRDLTSDRRCLHWTEPDVMRFDRLILRTAAGSSSFCLHTYSAVPLLAFGDRELCESRFCRSSPALPPVVSKRLGSVQLATSQLHVHGRFRRSILRWLLLFLGRQHSCAKSLIDAQQIPDSDENHIYAFP